MTKPVKLGTTAGQQRTPSLDSARPLKSGARDDSVSPPPRPETAAAQTPEFSPEARRVAAQSRIADQAATRPSGNELGATSLLIREKLGEAAHGAAGVPATKDDGGVPAFAFASRYTVQQVLNDPVVASRLRTEYLDQEGAFFGIARHPESGLTYDGINLDPRSSEVIGPRMVSAPSKECLDIGLCLKALGGDADAARVVGDGDVAVAQQRAVAILAKKLDSYERFNADNPGYAGFLPWFIPGEELRPTPDWEGDIPGLDNGEWVWTLELAEHGLEKAGQKELAARYHDYNSMLRGNVGKVFYDAPSGKVRADVTVVDPKSKDSDYRTNIGVPGRADFLTGEHGVHEGIMLVAYLTLFGAQLPDGAQQRIWDGIDMVRVEHPAGTTWQGFWGSSHESWAYLFMPLRDIQGYRDLFRIREKIRTHNAVERGYPGLSSSTNKPGEPGYLDGAGIEGIGTQPSRNNHVYAVYAAFPLLLQFADRADEPNFGLAWLLNMLRAPGCQTPIGGGESGTNDGSAISPMKTVDGSLPNVLAMLGGLEQETAEMMQAQGLYASFIEIMERQYQEAFGEEPLREPVDFVAPEKEVPRV